MKTRLLRFAGPAALAIVAAAISSAQAPKPPEGFTPIFDGKSSKGWHPSRSTRHGTTPDVIIENGELAIKQKPYGQGGLLFTDKSYKNFELYLEVKPAWGCNSGIFLRSTESGSAYQIELDQTRGMGALLGEGMRVTVGARPTEAVDKVWKIDEWNSIRIRMEGDAPHITEWINGVQVFDVQEPVNDKIAGETSGKIGLQSHWGSTYEPAAGALSTASMWKPDAAYRFRNIAIKELP